MRPSGPLQFGYSYGAQLDYRRGCQLQPKSAHIYRHATQPLRTHTIASPRNSWREDHWLISADRDPWSNLGFSVSTWIAHWCISVPLTYYVLFRSQRNRTLDGALSMLRQFVMMGALMLQLNSFFCCSHPPANRDQYGVQLNNGHLKTYADPRNIVFPKKTRINRFARKGANLFCSTLESALSRFQSRNVSF